MEIMQLVVSLLKELPVAISALISVSVLVVVAWLHSRKVSIEDKTTTSTVQDQQIKSLMEQIKLLSEELTQARHQLTEIHNQNVKLMEQLRKANSHIGELEEMLSKK